MKITLNESPSTDKPNFPAIYTYRSGGRELTVMAISSNSGIVLHDNYMPKRIGGLEDGFVNFSDGTTWEPFNGTVTLQND